VDRFARKTPEIRAEIFVEVAARMGVEPIIIEKDFWVCWTLKRVFGLSGFKAGLIFKGGTSLSKAYGAIHRFSEDIDLSIDRHDLGFVGRRDPASEEISGQKRNQLLNDLTDASSALVQRGLRNEIIAAMQTALPDIGIDLTVSEDDGQTLLFNYPASLPPVAGGAYLQDKVKLEFGARSDHLPAEPRTLTPYAATYFPDQLPDAVVSVKVLGAERTFWEKATILHMLYHRPKDKGFAKNMSRHYYDLAELAKLDVRKAALGNLDLLSDVALHKSRFYPAAWAKYSEASPPTLRLSPTPELERKLRADYRNMQEMIFGASPDFGEILTVIAKLETDINTST